MILLSFVFTIAIVNAQTKTEIKVTELQKVITDYIVRNYSGYTIEKAFRIERNGITAYRVAVKNDKSNLILVFDKDGKFLKEKEPQNPNQGKPTQPTN